MANLAHLSAIESDVMSAWQGVGEGFGFGFKVAAERCRTPLHQIRRAVRAIARKGLLEHCRCLWDEDEGTPKGGGYVLTSAGAQWLTESENAQGQGGDGTAPSQDDSPVRQDAPKDGDA